MATIEQLKKNGNSIYPVTTPKAVRDEQGHTVQGMIEAAALVNVIGTSMPDTGFIPNIEYDLGMLTGTVEFLLGTPADQTVSNTYFWTFDTGTTAPSVTWPSGFSWQGNCIDSTTKAPTIAASKHYEVVIRKGYAYCTEFDLIPA